MISTISKQPEGILKYVRCSVAGHLTNMLVDSGAKLSLLNIGFFNSLQQTPNLSKRDLKLSPYTGSSVSVLGTNRLRVNYESQEIQQFPFHLVRRGGNLIGFDLFHALGFNIGTPDSSALAIIAQENFYHVADRFPELCQSRPVKVIKNFRDRPDIDTCVPTGLELLLRVALIYQDKVTRGL